MARWFRRRHRCDFPEVTAEGKYFLCYSCGRSWVSGILHVEDLVDMGGANADIGYDEFVWYPDR